MEHAHTPIFPPKKTRLAFLSTLVLVLAGSFLTLDLLKVFKNLDFGVDVYLKVAASFFAALTAWSLGRSAFGGKDHLFLALAFFVAFLGDAANVVWTFVNPVHEPGWVSRVGIGLILAQIFLIIRHSKAFKFLLDEAGHLVLTRLIFPASFYLVLFAVFAWFSPYFWQAGFFTAAVIHIVFLATSLWVGWAALVFNVYPRRNGWMIALGSTAFFLMSAVMALYNLKPSLTPEWQFLSDYAYLSVWALYTPYLILLPYSGVDWER